MIKKKRKHANIVGESDGDGDGDGDNDNIIQPSTYTVSKPSSVSVLPANDSTNITNPKYGSKEYWEKRYSNALNDNHTKAAYEGYCQTTNDNDDGSVDNINKKSDDDDDDDASAGHEWYFTYQELKSLILPLILDCRGDEFDDWEDNEDDNTENDQEVDDDDGWEEVENDNENSSEENEEEEEGNNEEEDSIHDDGDNNNNNNKKDINNNSDGDGDGDGDDSDDDEFLEIFKSKIEQSILPPPKKLLEIGCGDVPILRDLCNDMLDLQSKTTGNIKSIIEQIICFDYSEIAIEFLIKDEKGKCDNTKEGHHEQELKVDYKVMDARTLNYQDKEFDLILDKGTLDAMLSDEIEGKENCLKIISEASRVLSLRGRLTGIVFLFQLYIIIFLMMSVIQSNKNYRLFNDCVTLKCMQLRGIAMGQRDLSDWITIWRQGKRLES